MQELMFVDTVLVVAILTTTALALAPRSRSIQAMGFLALGVVMCLVWLRLGSVDVALAEAALGAGLLSAILVWLAVRSGASPYEAAGRHRPLLRPILGVASGGVLGALTITLWLRVTEELPLWEAVVHEETPSTGLSHEVTAVLLAFRAYDTLLETAVLMTAGITVLSLGADAVMKQSSAKLTAVPPPMRWFVRVSAPVMILAGLWLLFAGSSDSGGAFQAGALFAGVLILLHTSDVDLAVPSSTTTRVTLVLGVLVFIGIGSLGPVIGYPWLAWGAEWSFAAMLVVEIVLTIGITAGLYVLYLGLLDSPKEVLT